MTMTTKKKTEREFFRTASHWLACQWQITQRKWHKAGPSLAGKKRAALQELIRETVREMRKAGDI
jgi:hypothetical protein